MGFSLFFFNQRKQNEESWQVFLFIDLRAKTKSFVFLVTPTSGRSLLAKIYPKRVEQVRALVSFGPIPRPCHLGPLQSSGLEMLFCGRPVTGLLPLETLSPGLTSWEFARAALWREPCPPLGRVFVVVYIVSKYVIPLRPSYVIYVPPVFRGKVDTKPLLHPSPAEQGYREMNVLSGSPVTLRLKHHRVLPRPECCPRCSDTWK